MNAEQRAREYSRRWHNNEECICELLQEQTQADIKCHICSLAEIFEEALTQCRQEGRNEILSQVNDLIIALEVVIRSWPPRSDERPLGLTKSDIEQLEFYLEALRKLKGSGA